MTFTRVLMALFWLIVAAAALFPSDAPNQASGAHAASGAVDLYGDPLPESARLRLGTMRFRHGQIVANVFFTHDGKRLISASSRADPTISVWEVPSGKPIRQSAGSTLNARMALSPDDTILAGGAEPNRTILYDVATGRVIREFRGHQGKVVGHAFSPDGKRLVTGSQDKTVRVWDVASGREQAVLRAHESEVSAVLFSPDGTLTASGDDDGKIALWDPARNRIVRRLSVPDTILMLAFSPDGKYLVATRVGENACMWDVNTGEIVRQFYGLPWSIAFSNDGKLLAAGDGSSSYPTSAVVALWDPRSGKELRRLRGHHGPITALTFSPDNRMLASGAADATVHLWDTSTGRELTQAVGSAGGLTDLVVLPNGKVAATGARDQSIRFWDLATGRQIRELPTNQERRDHYAFAQGGKLVAASGWNDAVYVWDTATGNLLHKFTSPTRGVTALAFSGSGKWLSWAKVNGVIILRDLYTAQERTLPDRMLPVVDHLAFSPDGGLLAAIGGPGRTMQLWEMSTVTCLSALTNAVNANAAHAPLRPSAYYFAARIAFSADGKMLAATGQGEAIQLYELGIGRERLRVETPNQPPSALALSPDGRLLAASAKWTIYLWDARTGKELGRLPGHEGIIPALAFTPDSKSLISGSTDTTALVWDVTRFDERPAKRAIPLSPEKVAHLWTDLAHEDARTAYQAIVAFEEDPRQALALFRDKLRPPEAVDANRVGKLIRDLDSNRFRTRDEAARQLEALGRRIRPELRKCLDSKSDEVRRRAKEILEKCSLFSGEDLVAMRVVEVLEHIATPEASALLESVARQSYGDDVRREAQAALARLAQYRGVKSSARP